MPRADKPDISRFTPHGAPGAEYWRSRGLSRTQSRTIRRTWTAAIVAIAAASLGAGAAGASTRPAPGVHIDPGSPAAKEYAIPLGQARAGGSAGGSGSSQLFGSGITASSQPPSGGASAPQTNGTAPGHRARGARHTHRHHGAQKRSRSTVVAPQPATRDPAKVLGSSGGGGSGIVWMIGAAALVLALGGLGGAAIARRGRAPRARVN